MIIWIIGLPGAGKTTIGREVVRLLVDRNRATVLLDGDDFRSIMGEDLGHSLADRERNGWRIVRMCAFLDAQGIDVVCCVLSMFPSQREWGRQNFTRYFEVFVDVSMEELYRRDQKGLYSGARSGRIKNVVGVDIPFPVPERPDFIVKNDVPRSDFLPIATEIVAASDRKMDS